MTIVYGGCVEPGGMKLDDDCCNIECPSCGKQNAISRFLEMNDGGCINLYSSVSCKDCGHFEGNAPDDDIEFVGYDFNDLVNDTSMCFLDELYSRVDEAGDKAIADIKSHCKQAINSIYQNFAQLLLILNPDGHAPVMGTARHHSKESS